MCGDDEALYYKGVICRVNKWDEAIPLGEMRTERRDTVGVNPVRIELRDKKRFGWWRAILQGMTMPASFSSIRSSARCA